MLKLKLDKRKKILLIGIALAIAIIVAVIVTCVVVLCGKKEVSLKITLNGQAVESCEIDSGGEKINFAYTLENSSKQGTASWQIEGDADDSRISDSGEFISGLKAGAVKVKLSVEEGGETFSGVVNVKVKPRGLESIQVTNSAQTDYIEGQLFNPDGYIVEGSFSNGTMAVIDGWIVENADKPLLPDDTEVVISYTENGIAKQTQVPIQVAPKTLQAITVTNLPAQLDYFVDDVFRKKGMVVTAEYEFCNEVVKNYSIDKYNVPLTINDSSVTITYTENGITKSAVLEITVTSRTLSEIAIIKSADKLEYTEGEYFDILGLSVLAKYSDSPDAITKRWQHNKSEALTTNDEDVVITYTENGITKTTTFAITVLPAVFVDPDVREVIEIINILPDEESLTLSDEGAVRYAGDLYVALSEEKRVQVTNLSKLNSLLDKLIVLEEEQPIVPETEYTIKYSVYNNLEFSDIDFNVNPQKYKNSEGAIQLNAVESSIATDLGYEFVHWVDETDSVVISIENIVADKSYFAVFALTAIVSIEFRSYFNKDEVLLTMPDVNRGTFDISSSGIAETIYHEKELLALDYYVEYADGTIEYVNGGSFLTNYNALILAYVVVVETVELHIASPNDVAVAWNYEYTNDEGEVKVINKDNLSEAQIIVPNSANVILYFKNPSITKIIMNDDTVGLFPPITSYAFSIKDDIKAELYF